MVAHNLRSNLLMKIAFPIYGERISPVLDVARRFILLETDRNNEVKRREVWIENTGTVAKAKRIAGLGSDVLICGAVSRQLEAILVSSGVWVIPNTCGPVDAVVAAFVAGQLTDQEFLMPGCTRTRSTRL